MLMLGRINNWLKCQSKFQFLLELGRFQQRGALGVGHGGLQRRLPTSAALRLGGTCRTVSVLLMADGGAAPPGEAGGRPLFFFSSLLFFFFSVETEETICARCNEAMAIYISLRSG